MYRMPCFRIYKTVTALFTDSGVGAVTVTVSKRYYHKVPPMLGHRLRSWRGIAPAISQHLVSCV